jgi:hypothetical protein
MIITATLLGQPATFNIFIPFLIRKRALAKITLRSADCQANDIDVIGKYWKPVGSYFASTTFRDEEACLAKVTLRTNLLTVTEEILTSKAMTGHYTTNRTVCISRFIAPWDEARRGRAKRGRGDERTLESV